MSHSNFSIKLLNQYSTDFGYLKIFAERLVVFFLRYWLLIDMLNGYLMKSNIFFPGGLSLGELSRIFFLIILLFTFKISKNKSEFLFVLIPFTLIFLSAFQYVAYGSNIVGSINISVKLSLPILLFVFIKENLGSSKTMLLKILYFNTAILFLNLFISLFGFGFFSYGESFGINLGGKGFFFAGNEVSAVLIALYAMLIFIHRKSMYRILLFTVLFLIGAVISLTKTSILGVFLIFVVGVFLFQERKRLSIISLFVIFVIVFSFVFIDYIIIAINRWNYFINRSGFLTYMSGGEKRWGQMMNIYENFKEFPLFFFTGAGWSGFAEQNFIDLVEGFGIFGIIIYLIWIYFGFYAYRNHSHIPDKVFVIFVFVILLTVATFAGHVVQSAMLAPFIGLVANMHYFNKNKIKYSL